MKYGLTEKELSLIIKIIASIPDIHEVILYGSRAMGNFKTASDIDLAIKGNHLPPFLSARLKSMLEETTIPYFFDLIDYATIDNPELKKHIDEKGVVLFIREKCL